jgi:tight adherence protein B
VFLLIHNTLPYKLLSFTISGLAATVPFAYLQMCRTRYTTRFDRALPDAIDVVARSLRAGHSLSAAIEIISEQTQEPVRSEFRMVSKQQNFGLPFRDALLELADRVPSADLHFLMTAMLVQKETGGNLVEILERTNVVIRERLRLEGEVRIYTAQGRLTGWVLGLLPLGMFLLINLVNPGYGRILLHDPAGQKMMGVGIVQILIGMMIIRSIVKVKV